MELDIDSVLKERKFFQKIKCGDDGKKDTPVPISNTEVKLLSADSSWGFLPARVGRCYTKSKRSGKNEASNRKSRVICNQS